MNNVLAKIIPAFKKPEVSATYEDIGGLRNEVARVLRVLETKLRR